MDVNLEVDLADAVGAPLRGMAIADAAALRAREAGDKPGEALARVVAASARIEAGAGAGVDEVEALARAALPLLEQADDHLGLVRVWWALGFVVANMRCRFDDMAEAFDEALRHARLAGQRRSDILAGVSFSLHTGTRPAGQALERADDLLRQQPSPVALLHRALLLAMLGRFDEARQNHADASAQARKFGSSSAVARTPASISSLAGDHQTAARHLRECCDEFEERGEYGALSTEAPRLGRELCALGRYDEAEQLARRGRELAARDDVGAQILWRQVQALVLAHRGRHAAAETLAREAVDLSEKTDALWWQGDALSDLAQVLEAAGRPAEAVEALEQALDRYRRKENLAMVQQLQPRLEALRTSKTA